MTQQSSQTRGVPAQGSAPHEEREDPPEEVDPVDLMGQRIFGAALEAMDVMAIAIGDRLGYYEALDGPAMTPPRLAAVTRTSERYAREWLEHQAMAGYVELIPGARSEEHSYRLAPGVAEVLARPGLLTSLSPLARQVAAAAAHWREVADGGRNGRGHAWADFGRDMRESQADLNGPQLRELLTTEWLPAALPELHERMAGGEALRVADIGCGAGWAAIAMATAYPGIAVDAFDIDPDTVDMARANVERVGLGDRVRVLEADVGATDVEAEYHLVTAFECVHDMPAPVDALAGVHRMLHADGRALVADMAGAEALVPDGDPVQRALYSYSVLVCLPDAMSGGAIDATGTVIRPATMNRYARTAGFDDVSEVEIAHDFWRFYVLHP
jgi:SAM-dependent methyltransferase